MNEFVHDTNLRQRQARQEIAEYVTALEEELHMQTPGPLQYELLEKTFTNRKEDCAHRSPCDISLQNYTGTVQDNDSDETFGDSIVANRRPNLSTVPNRGFPLGDSRSSDGLDTDSESIWSSPWQVPVTYDEARGSHKPGDSWQDAGQATTLHSSLGPSGIAPNSWQAGAFPTVKFDTIGLYAIHVGNRTSGWVRRIPFQGSNVPSNERFAPIHEDEEFYSSSKQCKMFESLVDPMRTTFFPSAHERAYTELLVINLTSEQIKRIW